jgi:competence protein ComEC
MASASQNPVGRPAGIAPFRRDTHLPRNIWRAPLVPVALALTAGILLDRYASLPPPVSLLAVIGCVLAWFCSRQGSHSGLPLVYLALAGVAFGAAYHHYRRDVYADNDIAVFARDEALPVQLRGVLDEEPVRNPEPPPSCLCSIQRDKSTMAVLRATHLRSRDDWTAVSGRLHVVGLGHWPNDLHAGDEVEVVGQLSLVPAPTNPCEFDFQGHLRDQGIRSELIIRKTPAGVTRLEQGWHRSVSGWLAVVRSWGQRTLSEALPDRKINGLATALLLGEGSTMTREEWDKYVRTGVIHVLAISGQHLVILAGFLWFALPRMGIRQRHAAWIVALVLLAYALLTGGRPPALRSAVAVCAVCGGLILRKRVLPANLFALSWLVVALINPTDLFTTGCQLSFLSVAVLYWGNRDWFQHEQDPLAQEIDRSLPAWQRQLRRLAGGTRNSYLVTAFIWLLITPLAALRTQLVAPVAVLLGPPVVVLTTIALFSGFLLLLVGWLSPQLMAVFAQVVHWSLTGCDSLVDAGDIKRFSYTYVGDIPEWWLWMFYLALLAFLTQEHLRHHWRWALGACLGWLCIGLTAAAARYADAELRCTFLAVGHGGCTVLEMPDGRTLLYDAGSLVCPGLTRRQIAPFLWCRGIHRIDEIILSHADLDHFNALVDLLDRFAVGQVTYTPTFADKDTAGVEYTRAVLKQRGIPIRIVKAGDRLTGGDVTLEVLHPPPRGPEGNENARSLVLEVRHASHTLLLTGDLEGSGLQRVLALPPRHVDVMMAPHHGSTRANTTELAKWARPRVVVSCQGRPTSGGREPYTATGAHFLGTWPHGAITVHSHSSGIVVETFVTKDRFTLRNEKKGR